VVISQGDMRIQSDRAHATGLNFANSKWDFEGNVRIDAEQRGNLRSDSAIVEFKDNHILRATVTGKPANFEQKRIGSEQMARGHADKILYDVNDGTIRLTNDAWLTDGQSEISGPVLVYNIRAQKVQAETTPDNGQRVHITIQPRSPGKDAGKTPDAGKPQSTPQS
jgi:lipopolysaccharide export system protein LptA